MAAADPMTIGMSMASAKTMATIFARRRVRFWRALPS
jgi:hypothetical protein